MSGQIASIANAEAGSSVRAKLNDVIGRVNGGVPFTNGRSSFRTEFWTTPSDGLVNFTFNSGSLTSTNNQTVSPLREVQGNGVAIMSTGATSATGRGGFMWPAANWAANLNITIGTGVWIYATRAWVETASDAVETFAVQFGFHQDIGDIADRGIYFEAGTRSRANNNWHAITRHLNTETATDTGVLSTTGFAVLELEVNAAATSVVFKINGNVVATHTTNIPSGSGYRFGFGGAIMKSLGTAARRAAADWLYVEGPRL